MCKSDLYFRPACGIVVLTSLAQWSVFTRGHGGYVSVPNQSCGIWTLSLCKRFLLFQWICIDAGHVSENALLAIFTMTILTTREFMSNLLSSLNYFCQSCRGLIAQENNNNCCFIVVLQLVAAVQWRHHAIVLLKCFSCTFCFCVFE